MISIALILGLPLAAASMLAFVPQHRIGGWLNMGASFLK